MSKQTERLISWAVMVGVLLFVGYKFLAPQVSWPSVGPSVPDNLQPLVQQIKDAMSSRQEWQVDAQTMAGFCHGCAKLLANEGRADIYYVQDGIALHDRMLRIGEAVIGPDWQVGERYPALAGIISAHLGTQPLLENRPAAVERFNELAACFYQASR